MPITLAKKLRQSSLKPVRAVGPGGKPLKAGKPVLGSAIPPAAPKPPPGYYNPDLDAGERAADRGLGDSRIDTDTANQRASTAYLTGTGRLEQDYGRQTSMLAQRFRQIGQANASAAVAQGVADPGTLAASLAQRRENQAVEQTTLDTARSRGLEDAGQDYQYGVSDRGLGLQRSERENTIFHLDTAEQRAFQARAAGYAQPQPKAKPKAKPEAKPKGPKMQKLSGGPKAGPLKSKLRGR